VFETRLDSTTASDRSIEWCAPRETARRKKREKRLDLNGNATWRRIVANQGTDCRRSRRCEMRLFANGVDHVGSIRTPHITPPTAVAVRPTDASFFIPPTATDLTDERPVETRHRRSFLDVLSRSSTPGVSAVDNGTAGGRSLRSAGCSASGYAVRSSMSPSFGERTLGRAARSVGLPPRAVVNEFGDSSVHRSVGPSVLLPPVDHHRAVAMTEADSRFRVVGDAASNGAGTGCGGVGSRSLIYDRPCSRPNARRSLTVPADRSVRSHRLDARGDVGSCRPTVVNRTIRGSNRRGARRRRIKDRYREAASLFVCRPPPVVDDDDPRAAGQR